MKKLRKVLVWASLSLIVQFSGLFYANNYLFAASGNKIVSKKIEENNKQAVKEMQIPVPQNASHINLSYDGKYIAFYEGEILDIVNTNNGEVKKIDFNQGVKVSYYKWLPDRNRMLIAEKPIGKNGGNLKLSYYDVDKDEKVEVKNIAWADSKSEVVDIKLSTLTNVIYIKVAHSGNRSSIYWLNIMHELKKVDTKGYMIGNMEVIPHEDKLVYEDLTYNKVNVTNLKDSLTFKNISKMVLITIDEEDNIYLGEVQNNKIVKVYSGTVKQPTDKWKSTALKEAINQKDVYVSSSGVIYTNDNLRGIITNIVTGKETKYEGRFLQLFSDGAASVSQGKLVKTKLNK
jgi:hypothetical protein